MAGACANDLLYGMDKWNGRIMWFWRVSCETFIFFLCWKRKKGKPKGKAKVKLEVKVWEQIKFKLWKDKCFVLLWQANFLTVQSRQVKCIWGWLNLRRVMIIFVSVLMFVWLSKRHVTRVYHRKRPLVVSVGFSSSKILDENFTSGLPNRIYTVFQNKLWKEMHFWGH